MIGFSNAKVSRLSLRVALRGAASCAAKCLPATLPTTVLSAALATGMLASVLLPSSALAQENATDFSSDGRSEFTYVKIQPDKSLVWYANNLRNKATENLGSFGVVGNHVAIARWLGRTVPELGVIALDDSQQNLVWKIKDQNGVTQTRTFGGVNDLAISGADFNGNGYADAAVVTYRGTVAVWRIWSDMFAPVGGDASTIVEIPFGKKGEQFFFASADGATDWIGKASKVGRANTSVRLRSTVTGREVSSDRFGAFAGAGALRPFPIKNPSGVDALGFEQASSSKTVYTVADLRARVLSSKTFTGRTVSVVGNFHPTRRGEEIGVAGRSAWTIYNPFQKTTDNLGRKTDIGVDFININTFSPSGGNDGDDDDDNSNDGPGAPIPPGQPAGACTSTVAWPSSHVYKTVGSTHFAPTDVRRNTIGVIVKNGGPGPFPNCIQAVDIQGNVVANLGVYARNDGYAARYYAGIGCGTTTAFNGSRVALIARTRTNSNNIYLKFGSVCYGLIDASRCTGSSQC